MPRSDPYQQQAALRRPSRRLLSTFSIYLRWYMGRAFHALRLARAERFPRLDRDDRTIICLNHPSWWDPLVSLTLSRHLAPDADHYAPMEASALARYGFMRRLGLFPLDTQSPRAGASFLRAAGEILDRPRSILWITPEGRFTDVRQRPVAWKPGIAALLARQPHCTVIPLALEYTFWDERLPEALALVGEPLRVEAHDRKNGEGTRPDPWQAKLSQAMAQTQDELAVLGMARDATAFRTLLQGGSGVSAPYNMWKRAQARWRRQVYRAEHGGIPRA